MTKVEMLRLRDQWNRTFDKLIEVRRVIKQMESVRSTLEAACQRLENLIAEYDAISEVELVTPPVHPAFDPPLPAANEVREHMAEFGFCSPDTPTVDPSKPSP